METTARPEMVLAIDFSLDRLDVALRGPAPPWIWGHRAYANNWTGYQQRRPGSGGIAPMRTTGPATNN